VRPWIALNPIAFPIEQARDVLVLGNLPHWALLAAHSVGGLFIAMVGYWWFRRTKRAFADVM
jgi:lipopolysaccharide transport system permease protein